MQIRYRCDRCDRVKVVPSDSEKPPLFWRRLLVKDLTPQAVGKATTYRSADLCDACVEQLDAWIARSTDLDSLR